MKSLYAYSFPVTSFGVVRWYGTHGAGLYRMLCKEGRTKYESGDRYIPDDKILDQPAGDEVLLQFKAYKVRRAMGL